MKRGTSGFRNESSFRKKPSLVSIRPLSSSSSSSHHGMQSRFFFFETKRMDEKQRLEKFKKWVLAFLLGRGGKGFHLKRSFSQIATKPFVQRFFVGQTEFSCSPLLAAAAASILQTFSKDHHRSKPLFFNRRHPNKKRDRILLAAAAAAAAAAQVFKTFTCLPT